MDEHKGMTPEELEGKLVIGELSRSEFPELTEQYQKIIDKVQVK